jgi:hypothetical protein
MSIVCNSLSGAEDSRFDRQWRSKRRAVCITNRNLCFEERFIVIAQREKKSDTPLTGIFDELSRLPAYQRHKEPVLGRVDAVAENPAAPIAAHTQNFRANDRVLLLVPEESEGCCGNGRREVPVLM